MSSTSATARARKAPPSSGPQTASIWCASSRALAAAHTGEAGPGAGTGRRGRATGPRGIPCPGRSARGAAARAGLPEQPRAIGHAGVQAPPAPRARRSRWTGVTNPSVLIPMRDLISIGLAPFFAAQRPFTETSEPEADSGHRPGYEASVAAENEGAGRGYPLFRQVVLDGTDVRNWLSSTGSCWAGSTGPAMSRLPRVSRTRQARTGWSSGMPRARSVSRSSRWRSCPG